MHMKQKTKRSSRSENKLMTFFPPHKVSQGNGKRTSQGTKPPTTFSSSTLHFTTCKINLENAGQAAMIM